MEIKHIRIRNYESVWSFNVSELFMNQCSVYHQCLSTDDQISVHIIIYIISYKTLLSPSTGRTWTHSESFSAGFLTDLHCRKSFLVLGTMLVSVTVEINRHEQCDSHDPESIPNTFLIWCSPWYKMMDWFLRADESPGLYLSPRSS